MYKKSINDTKNIDKRINSFYNIRYVEEIKENKKEKYYMYGILLEY